MMMSTTETNTPTTPDAYFDHIIHMPDWHMKLQKASQRLAFFIVNYLISLSILVLTFSLSQNYIAPLLSTLLPISHTTLPKAIMILTVMYWLPIWIDVVKRWRRNTF
jgi:hypothetical protein